MTPLLDNIVGAPYEFPPDPPRSFDCWALLVYVREQLGLDTPVDIDPERFSQETLNDAIDAEKHRWTLVSPPEDGDAVVFSPRHIGVAMGAGVLHAHRHARSVVYTRWQVVRRRWPRVEVRRP